MGARQGAWLPPRPCTARCPAVPVVPWVVLLLAGILRETVAAPTAFSREGSRGSAAERPVTACCSIWRRVGAVAGNWGFLFPGVDWAGAATAFRVAGAGAAPPVSRKGTGRVDAMAPRYVGSGGGASVDRTAHPAS